MAVLLLPRLAKHGVSSILEAFQTRPVTPETARAVLEATPSALWYGASGGHRSPGLADEIGKEILSIAASSGFPDNTSQVARSRFDRSTAIGLASDTRLETGESLRDDVWAYIATVVLPDVVAWRFTDMAAHRYHGGVRNALQRLWVRGTVLDLGDESPGRWRLVNALSEDAAVQIFERASIAGNKRLACAVAERWLRTATDIGRGRMEPVMRSATKVVRLRNEVVDLGSLDDGELEEVASVAFKQAIEACQT